MSVNLKRAMIAGVVGTAAMTLVGVFVAPMMGMPRMNPAEMLAGAMGNNALAGWAGHLMIGVALAIGFAAVSSRLPGAPWLRGALFALAPWLMAQIAVMPMMGMPLFSGSMLLAGGSLIGHLVYGAVLGSIYGNAISLRVPVRS